MKQYSHILVKNIGLVSIIYCSIILCELSLSLSLPPPFPEQHEITN